MKEINKIINNIPVTIMKTDKFKSVSISLYFKSPVTKENVLLRSLLRSILIESCNKYNTSEKLYINTLENYDAYYVTGSSRVGNYIINSFNVSSLKDRYTRPGNLEDVIDTFCEIIFNPFVKNKAFDKKTFDFIINKKRIELEEVKEESGSYAEYMTYKSLNRDKPYTYLMELEDLDKITSKSLYSEYLKMINESEVNLIVCGDIEDKLLDKITSNINNTKKYNETLIINNDDYDDKLIKKENSGYGTQNILNVIMYLKNVSDYELNYVIPIYRVILGGYASSRIFNIIREKHSLAYYAFARYEKDDSLINIVMGIEKENYDKALNLTLEIVNGMNKITNKELEEAKKVIITSLMESQDNINNVVSRKYNEDLFNILNTDEFISKIKEVKKEEIEKVALKIKPYFSHFLKGEINNE